MKVEMVMNKRPVVATKGMLVTTARALARDNHLRMLPVVDGEKVVGVVRDADLVRVSSSRSNITVDGFVSEFTPVFPEMEIKEAVRLLVDADEGSTPVVVSPQDYTLIGVFSLVDALHSLDSSSIPPIQLSDIMTREVHVCRKDEPVSRVWDRLVEYDITGMPVVDESDRAVGIVTRHDLMKKGYARIHREDERPSRARDVTTVENIMSTPLYMLPPEESVGEAIRLILKRNIGRITVGKENKIMGIVDRIDLARACFCR
jgi:predicted transcriptional regulator